ncbi:MAG: response regulator transcription factor [Chloroflexi bacterium]|nr:response regulator transcription factor [Chloroflexota bacterium]MCL5275602.1 response regulator transcription factor [Chloroflexota bacterium]
MLTRTILIIDDDSTLRELLTDYLKQAGYRVVAAGDGQRGLNLALSEHPDLVILDLMMPGMDGWEVCRSLRYESAIPIIMLTAKSEELDKLRGFRLGVDDFVTKPFSFAEIVARVGAVIARANQHASPSHYVRSDDLVIDFDQHRVTATGQVIDLTPTEYRLLEALARQSHRTISSEQLLLDIWGPTYTGDTEQIKHFIWTLRKKIEKDPGDPKHLITERGFGYRFE